MFSRGDVFVFAKMVFRKLYDCRPVVAHVAAAVHPSPGHDRDQF
jgi:hypothetical protein